MSVLRMHADHEMGIPPRVLDRAGLSEDIRRLSAISDHRAFLAIAREWLWVSCCIGAAVYSGHPLVYVLAGAFIATRQHAMLILMHDASHGRLTRNRALNDTLGDLLLGLPNNVLLRRYRIRHGAHHRYTNDRNQDPDRAIIEADDQWQFPRTRKSAIWVFTRDVIGLNAGRTAKVVMKYAPWPVVAARLFRRSDEPSPADAPATNAELLRLTVYGTALVSLLVLTGGWWVYLALWIAPSLTVLPALLRLRAISEHEGDVGTDEVSVSRHVQAGWVEALIFSPLHINHHTAHHVFPSVPWYNLPALHARLLKVPEYRDRLVSAPSYTGRGGVVDQLMPRPTASSGAPAS